MADLALAGPWAPIRSEAFTYALTDADVLEAGRMVVGEGDGPEVLWTMTQRFGGLVRRGTFQGFIRAYCQPINPRWRRDGEFCRPGGRYAGNALCAPALLDRRDRVSRLTWAELPEGVRALVLRWARGELDNPVPKAVDFAAKRLVENRMAEDPRRQLVHAGGSWFITSAQSNGWPPSYVRVGNAGERAPGGAQGLLWALGGAAVVGGLLWAWSRWRRR